MNSNNISNLILCLFFLLSGCVSSSKGDISESEPLSTQTFQEILTYTSTPLSPTATSMPTSSPTSTPYQTPLPLSDEDVAVLLQNLYETNGDCELPCWWGITVGKTSLHDAFDILLPIGRIYEGTSNYKEERVYTIGINIPSDFTYLTHALLYLRTPLNSSDPNYGLVTGISVADTFTKPYNEYVLADYLGLLGEPDQIYISYSMEYVFVFLFYVDEGIVIYNHQNINELFDDYKYLVCPQSPIADTWYWSLRNPETKTLEEMIAGVNNGLSYLPLEERSELTVNEFYQIYLDPETDICIEGGIDIDTGN